MANDELFIDVLAQIERHPETWQQGDWRCKTGMCFAGWAVELSGLEWAQDRSDYVWMHGEKVHCSDAAMELLGIRGNAGRLPALFAAANTLETLYYRSAQHMGIDVSVLQDKVRDRIAGG